MLFYNLRRALSFLLRFKSHTVYSLLGLTIGLACVFVIAAWTLNELRYDRFHHQADHIFMVTTEIQNNNKSIYRLPETPAPLAEELEAQIPQIEKSFHFIYLYGGRALSKEQKTFSELGIAVDSKFLEVLNFKLLKGNPGYLNEPDAIFLSESLAAKLFPGEDAMGKSLIYKETIAFTVKGIFTDVPNHSSLQFDFLISYVNESGDVNNWWQFSDATFILTSPQANREEVLNSIQKIWRENINDSQYGVGIISMPELRYGAKFEFFQAKHGDQKKLYLFIGIAILILILACFNYVNLISAYYVKRGNEIWVRKVHGARSGHIVAYFLTESILMSVLAWAFALLFSFLGIQFVERLLEVNISPPSLMLSLGFGFIVSVFIVGLASGIVPAIRVSSGMLKRSARQGLKDHKYQQKLRNVFILSQFILSLVLTNSSLVILSQMSFVKKMDLGYSREHIVGVHLPPELSEEIGTIRNMLETSPDVQVYSFAGSSPINLHPIFTTENWTWKGLPEGTHTSFYRLYVDAAYLDLFDIPVKKGRYFTSVEASAQKVVINEKLGNLLGFEDPVGELIRRGEEEFEIIGVVKDFHFQHLSQEILPLVLMYSESRNNLYMKITPPFEKKVEHIYSLLARFTEEPLTIRFMDEVYDEQYKSERKMVSGIMAFTLLSILLSCLGLVGLVSYSTELRTKEIAIRKVHGSTIYQIMLLLNLSTLRLFLLGLAVSAILTWVFMSRWLETFAFNVGIAWWIYCLGGMLILLIALLSVSAQTLKAARKTPAEALKFE
jgi:ABC-type antimicrobial peptide transport system permease subunit